jgi:hypothetical protein
MLKSIYFLTFFIYYRLFSFNMIRDLKLIHTFDNSINMT